MHVVWWNVVGVVDDFLPGILESRVIIQRVGNFSGGRGMRLLDTGAVAGGGVEPTETAIPGSRNDASPRGARKL